MHMTIPIYIYVYIILICVSLHRFVCSRCLFIQKLLSSCDGFGLSIQPVEFQRARNVGCFLPRNSNVVPFYA